MGVGSGGWGTDASIFNSLGRRKSLKRPTYIMLELKRKCASSSHGTRHFRSFLTACGPDVLGLHLRPEGGATVIEDHST